MLRAFACATTLAAALNTVIARENQWGIKASYKMFDGLKFLVAGNFIVSAYSLLTAPLVARQMSMNLLLAAATAASTIGYIGEKGNQYAGWYEICHLYKQFCHKTGISLFLSLLGFFVLFVICALSHRSK